MAGQSSDAGIVECDGGRQVQAQSPANVPNASALGRRIMQITPEESVGYCAGSGLS